MRLSALAVKTGWHFHWTLLRRLRWATLLRLVRNERTAEEKRPAVCLTPLKAELHDHRPIRPAEE